MHIGECLLTLFEIRSEYAECMSQVSALHIFGELIHYTVPPECFDEIESVFSQIVVTASHQIAWRKRCHKLWILRVYILCKGLFLIVFAVKISRKKHSDLVKAGGVEHSAYKTERTERDIVRLYMSCFGKCVTLVHCSRVGQKIGSATVGNAIYMVSVTLSFSSPDTDHELLMSCPST